MNCNPSLISSGDQIISWIAHNLRYPWLTQVMEAITNLGTMGAILFIMSFAYWCWNKTHAKTIIYGILISSLSNFWLKSLFMECRPPKPFHLQEISELSYSFPSGHAQISILMWAGLAYYVRSKTLSTLFILTGLLIAFSRNYLGVHYLHDVIAGISIGLIILLFCILNENKNITARMPIGIQFIILIAFLGSCLAAIPNQVGHLMIAVGLLFGIWLGSYFEQRNVRFTPSYSLNESLHYVFIGFGGILLLWQGGRTFIHLPNKISLIAEFFQYAFIGIWIMAGAPWFIKRKLENDSL